MPDRVPWNQPDTTDTILARPPGPPRPSRRAARGIPVVMLTGASSGIGAAVAGRLARGRRCELLLNGRDPDRLAAVAAATGGVPLIGDLTAPADCRDLARRALETTGQVDVLIAGAGVGWAGPFSTMPHEDIDRLLAVNLGSVLHLVRGLLPAMERHGTGHVVLVASIAGACGVGGEAVYSATKAGLCAFADGLRYEVRGQGVDVSVVLPGAVDTPFFTRRGTPYGRRRPRPLPPERVADAVYRTVTRRHDEVFVPGWLRFPARLHGAAPALFRRLAARLA